MGMFAVVRPRLGPLGGGLAEKKCLLNREPLSSRRFCRSSGGAVYRCSDLDVSVQINGWRTIRVDSDRPMIARAKIFVVDQAKDWAPASQSITKEASSFSG